MAFDREQIGAHATRDREAIGDLPPVACVRIPLPSAQRRGGRAEVDGHVVLIGKAERQRVEAREAPRPVRSRDAFPEDAEMLPARAEGEQVTRAEWKREVVAERERPRVHTSLRDLGCAAVQQDERARR